MANFYSCEKPCLCFEPLAKMKMIVITGGPGAGKTALLEFLRKILCEHIAILPEAASILFRGDFWRLDSASSKKVEQRCIYHIQKEMENLAAGERKWDVALCDRGSLDGLAYWPGDQSCFFSQLDTSLEREYAKYAAVIHLSPPPASSGYKHQNPLRIDSAEEALQIDLEIHEIWRHHPRYFQIESSSDFVKKLHIASDLVQELLREFVKNHYLENN